MSTTTRTALIVGAGIAGPVLAMFLQRAGITPVVYEGRPAPDDEAGAFLNLAPNGVAVLRTLGVAEEALGVRDADDQHRLPQRPRQVTRGESGGDDPDQARAAQPGAPRAGGPARRRHRVRQAAQGYRDHPAHGDRPLRGRLRGPRRLPGGVRRHPLPHPPTDPAGRAAARVHRRDRLRPVHARPVAPAVRRRHADDVRPAGLLRLPDRAVRRGLLVRELRPADRAGSRRSWRPSPTRSGRPRWSSGIATIIPPSPPSSSPPRAGSAGSRSTTCSRSRPGARDRSAWSATRLTPRRRTWGRAPRWRWRTRSCWPSACGISRTCRRRSPPSSRLRKDRVEKIMAAERRIGNQKAPPTACQRATRPGAAVLPQARRQERRASLRLPGRLGPAGGVIGRRSEVPSSGRVS